MKLINGQNLYDRLGIQKDASQDEVKSAFRKMAKKYHPDLNPENQENAKINFIAIGEAYEVLYNTTTRATYDRDQTVRSYKSEQEATCRKSETEHTTKEKEDKKWSYNSDIDDLYRHYNNIKNGFKKEFKENFEEKIYANLHDTLENMYRTKKHSGPIKDKKDKQSMTLDEFIKNSFTKI